MQTERSDEDKKTTISGYLKKNLQVEVKSKSIGSGLAPFCFIMMVDGDMKKVKIHKAHPLFWNKQIQLVPFRIIDVVNL